MTRTSTIRPRLWLRLVAPAILGTVMASSCSLSEVSAIVDSVQVAVDVFDDQANDASFGDWLLNELDGI